MNEVVIKYILNKIDKTWPSITGLVSSEFLSTVLLSSFFWNSFNEVKTVTIVEWLIIIEIDLVIFLAWIIYCKYPKTSKGKIGIVLAIETENDIEAKRIRNDFFVRLKQQLSGQQQLSTDVQVFILHEFQSKDLSREKVELISRKTKCHLIVFGSCFVRQQGSISNFKLSLNISVKHGPISEKSSSEFSQEISKVMSTFVFPVSEELVGFELTSNLVDFGILYVIGIASFLSNDFELSIRLMKQLKGNQSAMSFLGLVNVSNNVDTYIISASNILLDYWFLKYRSSRNREILKNTFPYLLNIEEISPNLYSFLLMKAMVVFLFEKNPSKALSYIKKCHTSNVDLTWKYNEAFLIAYMGNLDVAEKIYLNVFRRFPEPDIVFQTEEFIYEIVEKEADKYQLWYCLALINKFTKKDDNLAKEYFLKFLERDKVEKKFPEQTKKSVAYIG